MRALLETYWRWMLIPFLLVLGSFAVFLWLTGDAEPSSDFVYPLF